MARAQQVVGLLLVQRHRAADVGADLGVGDDAVVGPVLAARRTVEVAGVEAHEQHDRLGLLLQLVLVQLVEPLGDDVEGGAERDVRGLDGRAVGVAGEARLAVLCPHGVRQLVVRSAGRGRGRGTRPGAGASATAPIRVLRISGRRPKPDSSTMSSKIRDGGLAVVLGCGSAWRSSETSWSGMRALAQWTIPMPMPSRRKRDADAQQGVLERIVRSRRRCPDRIAKYATRKIRVPTTEMPNRVATCRSALFAAFGSVSARRKRCGGIQDPGTSPPHSDQP